MIFAQVPDGHEPNYLELLIEGWDRGAWPGAIDVVAAPKFAARHRALIARAARARAATAWVMPPGSDPVHPILAAIVAGRPSEAGLTLAEAWWDRIAAIARERAADQVLIMRLDPLLHVAAGGRAMAPFCGIAVTPPRPETPNRAGNLRATLAHPALRTLFFIDPGMAAFHAALSDKAIAVPDPVRVPVEPPSRAAARAALGIDDDRRVVLFFGQVSKRKGIWPAIQALARLSDAERRALAFVVAGEPSTEIAEVVVAGLAGLREGGMQVRADLEFVDESRVTTYFAAADVVLAPHQNHPGMSGVMLLAAAHGRPLVTQDFGTVGQLTRHNALGLAVDPTQPASIASAIRQILAGSAAFDPARAAAFAARHDPARFAAAIFDRVFGIPNMA